MQLDLKVSELKYGIFFQKKIIAGALFCLFSFLKKLASRPLRVIEVSTVTLTRAIVLRSLKTLWIFFSFLSVLDC